MGYYYVNNKKYTPLHALPVGYHRANIHIFMAKFYRDKPLAGKYELPEWVTPIQVGAALCKERVANILDCDGENISEKNANYSELTALYWMWKNRLNSPPAEERDEYYGLAHYRRVLDFTEDDELRLVSNDVDVVLPYPMPYEPDIEAHHNRYLKGEDWDICIIIILFWLERLCWGNTVAGFFLFWSNWKKKVFRGERIGRIDMLGTQGKLWLHCTLCIIGTNCILFTQAACF